jgi:hypothetical protein
LGNNTKKRDKQEKEPSDQVLRKLEDMDNKLELIKSDTNNLNRIASLSNSGIIITELQKIIGGSKIKAAILHLTKDKIGAQELADAIGINIANLAVNMKPFLGTKGYIVEIREGRNKYFLRSQLVDLIGYESAEEFAPLISSWQSKRGGQAKTESSAPVKEDKDGT